MGCKKTKSFTIGSGGSNLDIAIASKPAQCGGNGSAWVDVTGGQPNYSVRIWGANNVDQTATVNANGFEIADIPAGSYSMSVTDAHGCQTSKTFVIGGGGSLAYSVSPTGAVCGGKGSVSVNVSAGSPSYSVDIWGPNNYTNWFAISSNSFNVTDLVAGSYTIEITDINDCKQTRTFVIGTSGSTVTLGLEATNATCKTAGSIWATSGGGQAPYQVSWSGPSSGSQTSSSGSVNITGLSAGSYTVTSKDNQGCVQTQTIAVGGASSDIGLVANATNGNCSQYGYIDVSVSSGQAPYNVSWSGPSSNSIATNRNAYKIQNLAGGTYTCLLYTSPSPRDATLSRMPSSA